MSVAVFDSFAGGGVGESSEPASGGDGVSLKRILPFGTGNSGLAAPFPATAGVSIECTFSFGSATTEPFERTNTYLLSMKTILPSISPDPFSLVSYSILETFVLCRRAGP